MTASSDSGRGAAPKGHEESSGGADPALARECGRLVAPTVHDRGQLDQPVFPSVDGGFRDPANGRRELREARGKGTLAWITSHTFRKTPATILDEAALSARLVADQLEHSRP